MPLSWFAKNETAALGNVSSDIDIDMLADISILCFHLSLMCFNWSDSSEFQPIFRFQISLKIILPCSKDGDTNQIVS